MDKINFTSRITPLKLSEFSHLSTRIGYDNAVNYPWTINQSVISSDVFTTGVRDCSTCLLTNGKKAVLMHLCPSTEENHMFSLVFNFLKNAINFNDENLQAVLVGSKNTKTSLDIWNKFLNLLNEKSIPVSILRNGKTPTHIAYRTDTDEVYVTNKTIDKFLRCKIPNKESLIYGFEQVSISPFDEIV